MDFLARFLTRNGLRLRGHVEGRPGRAALLIHGLGDHARAIPYLRLRAALVDAGWRVYSFDLPGHGLSEGERVYTPAWRCLGDDVNDVIEIAAELEKRPIFVLGLSMGGLLALHAALQARRGIVAGVVAMAPALSPEGAPWIVRKMLVWIGRFTHATPLPMGLRPKQISRDDTAVAEYLRDELFQRKCSPGLALALMEGMAAVQAGAGRMQAPLFVLHGSADRIAPAEASARFIENAGSPDKERKVYLGARHNLLLESNSEEVIRDVLAWLAARA